jgi:hypothetical protein
MNGLDRAGGSKRRGVLTHFYLIVYDFELRHVREEVREDTSWQDYSLQR